MYTHLIEVDTLEHFSEKELIELLLDNDNIIDTHRIASRENGGYVCYEFDDEIDIKSIKGWIEE